MLRRVAVSIGLLASLPACPFTLSGAEQTMTQKARELLAEHEARVRPLDVAANRAWWEANTTGSDAAFKRKVEAQNLLDEALADRSRFARLKELKEHQKEIDDPILARAVKVLYLAYLEKQVDPSLLKKMVAKANAVEQTFNVFRAKVDGQAMPDNQVRELLKKSHDPTRRKAVWEASKAVGGQVEGDLRELVRLRNQAARELGFPNFHALQLYLNEQDGKDLIRLFDELDELTREPFLKAKAEIDTRLAKTYGIEVRDLRPWHYHDPFFQESPAVFEASLDAPYAQADILDLCRRFYEGIGLPIDQVIARSDLYPKPGKSQHAFCQDIDREGDVRVLGNIMKNEFWMGTMLHELGHSVYSTHNNDIPRSLPYTLRVEAHILTTEGVAMMFERWSKSRPWLEKMGVHVDNPSAFDDASRKILRNQLLIFSRWCQVMLRFEKGMYENPEQDLNKLWWDLVEKYQGLVRPEGRNAPDYASKIHIITNPVYYHNYMMGQLFASQVHHAICKEVLHGADPDTALYVGNKDVGQFMKEKVFAPGRTLDWNGLTRNATGENLNAGAFAADFREQPAEPAKRGER